MLRSSPPLACALALTLAACGKDEPAGAEDGALVGEEDAGSLDANVPARSKLSCNDADVLCYDFGPIELEPGGEWQGFQALPVGNDIERAIVRLEIDQVGAISHHYIIAPWSAATPPPLEGPYDLFTEDGLKFVGDALGGIVAGSVYRYVDISTGDSIGVRIPANAYLVNNGHYLNPTTEAATGVTRVKIQTVPADQVEFLAVEAQPGTTAIEVPPGERRVVGSTWDPPEDVAVLLMTAHMHRHGRLFQVWSVIDGVETQVYETTDYEAPPLEIFSGGDSGKDPIVLRPGRGDHLRFECTHENDDLDITLTYGPYANTSEMCVMPVYYVTRPDALLEAFASGGERAGFGWEYEPYGG